MGRAKENILALVLAAGKGTRMISDVPKVLHEIHGKPLLGHVLDVLGRSGIKKTVVVAGHGESEVRSFIENQAQVVRQVPQLGTGHAVLCAKKALSKWQGSLLVIPGDAPCVNAETIKQLISEHQRECAAASILTAVIDNPHGYGRIVRKNGKVVGIREELDASDEERLIREVNSSIYLFDVKLLLKHLDRLKSDNQKREYYLTDVVESFVRSDLKVIGVEASEASEVFGINSRADLAKVNRVMNLKEIEKHQKAGVTILSPENTFIGPDVKIGKDTVVRPFSWIEKNVTIGKKCSIGPFATIRETSVIDDGAIVGCYVEVVRSRIGKNAKVKHLAYLGDASLGEDVNIGAGTITANFDGSKKHKTIIGKKTFIGSNTVLIAPVKIGSKAKTGAGAVVLSNSRIKDCEIFVGVTAK